MIEKNASRFIKFYLYLTFFFIMRLFLFVIITLFAAVFIVR